MERAIAYWRNNEILTEPVVVTSIRQLTTAQVGEETLTEAYSNARELLNEVWKSDVINEDQVAMVQLTISDFSILAHLPSKICQVTDVTPDI